MSDHAHAADVIIVGAGPAGSATAHRLASAGRDVLLLEKASLPRDKVCGDGLTPRAVRSLIDMGVDVPWSLEVCNDGAWGHPGADHVRAVADAMRDVLARARHAQPEEMP